jgi:DNA-binding HxlR family transcriptional regulator
MTKLRDKTGAYTILRELYRDEKSFGDFLKDIPRRTLADRLREFEQEGYLKRKAIMTHPISVKYSITEKGREAFKSIVRDVCENTFNDLVLTNPNDVDRILSSYIDKERHRKKAH